MSREDNIRNALNFLYKASGWGAALSIVVICIIVTIQTTLTLIDKIVKYITGNAIGLSLPSYGDFTGFFLTSATFLALTYTFRQGEHIRVNLFINLLPASFHRGIEIWCTSLAAVISIYFTWYSAMLVMESFTYNDLSPGMIAVPIWIPQNGMFLGLLILSIALIDELISLFLGATPSYKNKEK